MSEQSTSKPLFHPSLPRALRRAGELADIEAADALEAQSAEIDRLQQKLTAAVQLAVRQGNEIRRLQRACRDQAERQQS